MAAKKAQKATMEIVGEDATIVLDETAPEKPQSEKPKPKPGDAILDDPQPLIEHNKALQEQMRQEPYPEKSEAPAPKPKPGDADYDWSVLYGTDELFHHTFPDGMVVALKRFGSIFSKTWMLQISDLNTDIDIELAAIRRGTCPAAWSLLNTLDPDAKPDPVDELWKAWSGPETSNGDGQGLTSGN